MESPNHASAGSSSRARLPLWLPGVLFLLTVVATSSGCASGPKLGWESNQDIDLNQFRSYALIPLDQRSGTTDPGATLRYAQPVEQAVSNAMTRLGYSEASRDEADVVLNVRGRVVPKTQVTDWGYGYQGYGRWGTYYGSYGRDITVDQYDEGTLIIEAFPQDSKTLAWVGWATDRVYERPTAEEIQKVVEDILAQFPPAAN